MDTADNSVETLCRLWGPRWAGAWAAGPQRQSGLLLVAGRENRAGMCAPEAFKQAQAAVELDGGTVQQLLGPLDGAAALLQDLGHIVAQFRQNALRTRAGLCNVVPQHARHLVERQHRRGRRDDQAQAADVRNRHLVVHRLRHETGPIQRRF